MKDKPKGGFWRRQFAGEPTRAQTRFDLIVGVLLPLFCLVADPIVFSRYDSILTRYRWLAYTFIVIEVVVLGLWLALRRRLTGSAAFFVGPLGAGGVFAFLIGLGILPISVVGMLVVIGVLGFTPFFTSVVFFRNGVRALARSRGQGSPGARVAIILAGILFIGTPSLLVLQAWHRRTLPQFMREAGSGLNGNFRMGAWIWNDNR
jgi:hypothetical protein